MTVMSNICNVCGFLWSLILIMLCVILGIAAEHTKNAGMKKLCRRSVIAAAMYLAGMLLILTGIGIFAALGFILHFVSEVLLFISLCIFISGHFGLRERLYDGDEKYGAELKESISTLASSAHDNIKDAAKRVSEAAEKTADSCKEGIKAAASAINEKRTGSSERKEKTAHERTDYEKAVKSSDENVCIRPDEKYRTEAASEDTGSRSDNAKDDKVEEPESGKACESRTEENDAAESCDKAEQKDDRATKEAADKKASPEADTEEMSNDDPESLSDEDRVIYDFFNTPESMLGQRVLIAAESAEETDRIKDIFRWTDADIITADGGAEAIQICRELTCDMLIIDHRLRDFDGLSAFGMIHRDEQGMNGYTPGIAVTSENRFSRDKYINAGFREVLYKPFDVCQMRRVIYDAVLDNKRPVTKSSTDEEKLKYLEHSGLRVRMGLTNEDNDMELYLFLLKSFRDSSAVKMDKMDRLIEDIDSGEDMWEFLLKQAGDLRRESSELGNSELGELFDTIARLVRAEDIESIKNRMPLVKNLWNGFASMLSFL